MLAENITYLKKNNQELFQVLKVLEKQENIPYNIEVEETKTKSKTIKLKQNDQVCYIHSKYNPEQEAKTIINQVEDNNDIDENSYVIFYGLGLGYHIDEFVNRNPQTMFSIYEPSLEIISIFFNNRETIKKWKNLEMLSYGFAKNSYQQLIRRIIVNYRKKTVMVTLPVYEKIFQKEYQEFLENFKQNFRQNRVSLTTNYVFRKRWSSNSINNIEKLLETPNITMSHFDFLKGKTAILVSAGPSLNFEIETLKEIKKNKDAIILAVGSSINTLIDNNIHPDAMCSFDAGKGNQLVFQKLIEEKIDTIPLLFGSAIGYEILEKYPGPKYHFITSRDLIGQYILKYNENELIKIISDAPSVANLSVELLYVLGVAKIILVGQNLAYFGDKSYADGIEYRKEKVDLNDPNLLETKDVYGQVVKTTRGFLSMKNVMESYVANFNIEIINTTVGGAAIEGTKYQRLGDVELENKPKEFKGYFHEIEKKQLYDLKYMTQQIDKIEKEYNAFYIILKNINKIIQKLQNLVKNNNKQQADAVHRELDVFLKRLESNIFFILIERPMNTTEYSILTNEIERLRSEVNIIKKLSILLPKIKNFIDILYKDKSTNDEQISMLKKVENHLKNA